MNKGFSLIEALIVTAAAGVVGVLLVALLVQNNLVLFQQWAKSSQGIDLNNLTAALSSDIKSAQAVAAGYPPSSPTYSSSVNTLVLELPSLDSGGNIIPQTFDYVVVSADALKPKVLREMSFPDSSSSRKAYNHVLTTNLSSVNFGYLDNNNNTVSAIQAVKVSFSVSALAQQGIYSQQASASARVSLRNQ